MLDTLSFSLINWFNFTKWFVKFLNLEEAVAIQKLHYTRQHLFFMIHSMTWNTTAFPKADAVTGAEASGGTANALRWAELSRGDGAGKQRYSAFSLSPPSAWHLWVQPMRTEVPKELLDAFGMPWASRGSQATEQLLHNSRDEQQCWLLMEHPELLPFPGIPTALGCYSLFSHIILCHNHPSRNRIQC